MKNSSVWNLLNPLRTGNVPVLSSGQEMFGTVIKHGINDKTVKVRVHFRHWNHMFHRYLPHSANYLAHDEENFCRTGDKVVIQSCGGHVSEKKSYFVRNVVKQFPRNDYVVLNPETTIESKTEFHELYKKFLESQTNKKQDNEKKKEEARNQALEEAMERFKVFQSLDEKTKKKLRKRSKEIKANEAAEKLKTKPRTMNRSAKAKAESKERKTKSLDKK